MNIKPMRKVVFIENRGKTGFWLRIAQRLQEQGHATGWIVQNPSYAPPTRSGEIFSLGFPVRTDLDDAPIPEAVSTDRGRQYFEAGSGHYSWYASRIAAALDQLRPDAVVGEITLMHELLAIAECRRRSVPYLHPTMTRYPGGRFSIFDGDTQIPLSGSNETWDPSRLGDHAKAISSGQAHPSYMTKPAPHAARMRQLRRVGGQALTALGWLRGERFNTPSPARKIALQRQLKENLRLWAARARMPRAGRDPVVLYPLQMQPEANIDVWGRPYSDQTALVRRLLAALPPGGSVAVKANPKPKYETSNEILALARENDRVILLPIDCPMDAAQAACIGAVTVSGTVGLEAVFGRGRCLSLRHPVLARHFSEFHADSPEIAVHRLLTDLQAGRGSVSRGAGLLAQLVADSFEGTINEPSYDPSCVSHDNLDKVARAINQVLAGLPHRTQA